MINKINEFALGGAIKMISYLYPMWGIKLPSFSQIHDILSKSNNVNTEKLAYWTTQRSNAQTYLLLFVGIFILWASIVPVPAISIVVIAFFLAIYCLWMRGFVRYGFDLKIWLSNFGQSLPGIVVSAKKIRSSKKEKFKVTYEFLFEGRLMRATKNITYWEPSALPINPGDSCQVYYDPEIDESTVVVNGFNEFRFI